MGGARVGPSDAPPARSLSEAGSIEELRSMLDGVVDEETGVVRLLVPSRGSALDPALPVTASAVLCAYTEGTFRNEREAQLGSGKGFSTIDAFVGAVGEAVERYSAARYRKEELRRAAPAEMRDDFLDPRRLCLYAEEQYGDPELPFARLDPSHPIDWAAGFWIDDRSPVWMPALQTFFDYHAHGPERFCQVTSSGLAAGPTLDDAALSATLELVERDAFVLSWMARVPGRRVLLDGPVPAAALEIVRELGQQGARIELYLLDVGVPIPTIACVGYGDGKRWPGATVALATHLSPRAAIRKAILEQGHVGPYVRRIVAEGTRAIPAHADDVRTLEEHALYYAPEGRAAALAFLGEGGTVRASDLPEPDEISLGACAARLRAAGLRAAVADVTSPDLRGTPFRVARALGHDFQQIHFGHRRARLGNPRLRARLGPAGVNPDPHPLA
jgi:ribosomal protein S12 methylthiotransferase accessory factor